MNLTLVNDTFNRFFSEPGESELQSPTEADIARMRQGMEALKRRLREITPESLEHNPKPYPEL